MSVARGELPATWGVVPVKSFERAKSRFSGWLDDGARTALARDLCEHVLGIVGGVRELAGVAVVTDCAAVARLAAARGAMVLRDASSGSLGRIVDAALAEVAGRGAGGALVLMSDLPHLHHRDLSLMLDLFRWNDLVLAPDRHDEGTNALALRAPQRFHTELGRQGSFHRHLALAAKEGRRVAVLRSAGLAWDVDGPADLRARSRPHLPPM